MPKTRRSQLFSTLLAVLALVAFGLFTVTPAHAADPCGSGGNPVACENAKPGTPESQWQADGADTSLVGFPTEISVDAGTPVSFKVKTDATAYTLQIFRLGWYGGDGARRVASLTPDASQANNQPACLTEAASGLVDCGNWKTSATWSVPAEAVSGLYYAVLNRADTGGDNSMYFVVRNDDSRADVVFQTADTTWQAYNRYGGNSLYSGAPAGRAFKASYNRPLSGVGQSNMPFNAEVPMLRFLERNGYDVSYISGLDTERAGALLENHKLFLSVGHDEYWGGQQRANVEAARDAGVHLAFFAGNEAFWKIRWAPSLDAAATPNRTIVCYKETLANAKTDPTSTWTGTWRDPRFSPPSDGGRPENSLIGQQFLVNGPRSDALTVPAEYGKMRLWRNTAPASQAAGGVYSFAPGTLGYEWNAYADNGSQPAGVAKLSSTTVDITGKFVLQNFGSDYQSGIATHNLTLYRHPSSRALVFGAGTVQWAWGLDEFHSFSSPTKPTTDVAMQQATVNLFADMGLQPSTVMSALVTATESTDTSAPTATITSPAVGATIQNGQTITLTGTASDAGGGRVAAVEVSGDGGRTWHPATGRANWTYTYDPVGIGATALKARAVDDSANLQVTPAVRNVTTVCPCGLFGEREAPSYVDTRTTPIEVGVKFVPSVSGFVQGIRFHKGTGNTGTHVGSLWSGAGTRLAQVTFTDESATGWQTATFPSAVPVDAGTTYIASYFAPVGRYGATKEYLLYTSKVSAPLTAPQATASSGNGVYRSGAAGFPNSTYRGGNYWTDVVFDTDATPDTTAPRVVATNPESGAGGTPITIKPSVDFSEPVTASSVALTLRTAAGTSVPGAAAYNSASLRATFTPASVLAASTDYVLAVSGATDAAGNAMTASSTTFRTAGAEPTPVGCPCTLFAENAVPAVTAAGDSGAVELGVKFTADTGGFVTGVRFYKGTGNGGTHTGSLWTSSGTRLAQATFTGETATGWQDVRFAEPVAVSAGATYIASYHAPQGRYAFDQSYFAAGGVDNAPLRAPSGANGVYAYSATGKFPTSSYKSTNYWVDPVFTTVAPTSAADSGKAGAPAISKVTATGSGTSATVRWTTNEISTSKVVYGVSAGKLDRVATNPRKVTAHQVSLTGLARNTRYHYRVVSSDPDGNTTTSPVSSGSPASYRPRR